MSQILVSEGFERSANALTAAIDRMQMPDFERFASAVERFSLSVDKLQTILGMKAENDQCKQAGETMVYTEGAFRSV